MSSDKKVFNTFTVDYRIYRQTGYGFFCLIHILCPDTCLDVHILPIYDKWKELSLKEQEVYNFYAVKYNNYIGINMYNLNLSVLEIQLTGIKLSGYYNHNSFWPLIQR